MKNTMEYRGYTGSVEFSVEDKVFLGKYWGLKPYYHMRARMPKNCLVIFME